VAKLTQASSTLSKRRRAKETRIGNRGTLSTEKSRYIIEQRTVRGQLRAERREKRAQKQGATRAARRCRVCRGLGYTSRNCTGTKETAVELSIEVTY
jgi:hypothetical protein